MTVDYELTPDDLIKLNVYHHYSSPAARRQFLKAWLIPAALWIAFCLILWFVNYREGTPPGKAFFNLTPLLLGLLFYLLAFPRFHKRKLAKLIASMLKEAKNRGTLGPSQITLRPDCIIDSNASRESITAWNAVERVVVDETYAYIYTSAFAALIVPRRAFASQRDFDAFVRRANEYHRAASNPVS